MDLTKLTALAADLPDQYKEAASNLIARMGEVIEGIGDEPVKWRAGTVKLMQAVSDRAKAPKGAQIGDLILNETILNKPTKVIVLRSWDARQYWSPDQNETKMLCSSPDAELGYIGMQCRVCPHSKYDEEAKSIDCNKIKVFLVVTADLSDVFMVNFAKTGYKTGTEWQSTMKKAMVSPYRRIYGLSSETSKQFKNVETITIETYSTDAEKNTPAELVPFVTELFNQVGGDRKEMLDNFHKIVLSRKSDPALLAQSSGGADSVVLIEDGTPATETEVKTEAAPKKQSASAKQYTV